MLLYIERIIILNIRYGLPITKAIYYLHNLKVSEAALQIRLYLTPFIYIKDMGNQIRFVILIVLLRKRTSSRAM